MTRSKTTWVISLLLLTACATDTDPGKQSGCPRESIQVQNEETGEYDCVHQMDLEKIIDEIDEVRW